MIEAHRDETTGVHRIVLQPNASMSNRQASLLLAGLAVAMGTISALFAGMGAWLVLPFAGAEWVFLACCFHQVLKRLAVREVITITDDAICVERGCRKPEQVCQFQRPWVGVDWVRPPAEGRASRLFLRLHARRIEVGDFLVEAERERLACDLRRILAELHSYNMSSAFEERAL